MKYSLCIEAVFPQLDFCDRILAAKECGVDAIEFWDATQKDIKKIAHVCAQHDMPIAAISVANSWQVRLNDTRAAVLAQMEQTLLLGKALHCNTFIGLAGDVTTRSDPQKAVLIENLKAVATLMEQHGACLVVEALNSRVDHKGYSLDSAYDAFEIAKCINSPGVKILYDCYHMQVMEGNIIANVTQNIDFIGHFHCAGTPGRHEPYRGELHYPALLRQEVFNRYDGYFGLEFWPQENNHHQAVRNCLNYFQQAALPNFKNCNKR